jgi:YfiH family protein
MNTILPFFVTVSNGIRAAVSTRVGGVSPRPLDLNLSFQVGDDAENVTKNRELFFGSLGIGVEELAVPQQIHGNTVRTAERPGYYPSCDALLTGVPGVYLCVTVADCVPLLIYDARNRVVAAAHAGWRGSLAQITTRAIVALKTEYNSRPENLHVFVGPAAGVCCYEVGPEVAGEFDARFVEKRGGKNFLDLKSVNFQHLSTCGIPQSRIEVSTHCTICEPDLFHSFRRDKERSGRMMGVIGLRPLNDHPTKHAQTC